MRRDPDDLWGRGSVEETHRRRVQLERVYSERPKIEVEQSEAELGRSSQTQITVGGESPRQRIAE